MEQKTFALLKLVKATSDHGISAGLMEVAADLEEQLGEPPPAVTTKAPDVLKHGS